MRSLLWIAILLGTCGLWAADPPDVNLHLSKAHQFERKSDFVHAETEFKLALSLARKENQQNAVAHALEAIGYFYEEIGNFSEADGCLKRAYTIRKAQLENDNAALASSVHALASLYIEIGQKEKAERLDLEGWVVRLEKSDSESRNLAHLLEDLAAIQALRGDFTAAEASYLRARNLIVKLLGGPDSAEQAAILNNLGLSCLQARRYDAAIEYLSQALTMWEHLEHGGAANTGFTAHSLALAYQGVGRSEEAEQHFRQALDLVEKIFGAQNLRTAAVLESYSGFLSEQNRKAEAKKMEARARDIVGQSPGQISSPQTVDVRQLSLRPRN
jgi:tetratricopeptide (TPR) repeat protein